MTAPQATTRCLREIIDRDHVAITLLRSFSDNEAKFHGFMKWVLHKKQESLVLMPSLLNRAIFDTMMKVERDCVKKHVAPVTTDGFPNDNRRRQ